jgi:hypothetical protein
MTAVDANRNLVFGLLALQTGLIDQDQLVNAFRAWSRDPARALADHLADRGELDPEQRAAVEALVSLHLKKHGGDPEKSLAAVAVPPSIRRSQSGSPGTRHHEPPSSIAPCPGCDPAVPVMSDVVRFAALAPVGAELQPWFAPARHAVLGRQHAGERLRLDAIVEADLATLAHPDKRQIETLTHFSPPSVAASA